MTFSLAYSQSTFIEFIQVASLFGSWFAGFIVAWFAPVAVMINPKGKVEYRYEKTISWYPTDSDGKIPVIDTPYGKLSTSICFNMDYPKLISQAKDADIMLVPGFDTKKISDYHTRVSFLRGIENGFTVIRQANQGTSIAADYLGNTLSYQKYFNTDKSRIMITDAPTKGVWTLYGFTSEVFLYIIFAGFAYMIFGSIKNRLKFQYNNLHKSLS